MSIASQLVKLADNKAAIKSAIEAKSPTVPPTDSLAQWPEAIASIPSGGEQQDEWTPPSDWPDIRKILADDITPQEAIDAGATHKWIMLCDPGAPQEGYGIYNYTFYSGNQVYFKVADSTGDSYEQSASSSLLISPLNNGVPFWIIIYTVRNDTFSVPGPHGQPYSFVKVLWIHAPDMVKSDNGQTIAGFTRIRSIELGGFTGRFDYLTLAYSNRSLENMKIGFLRPVSGGGTGFVSQGLGYSSALKIFDIPVIDVSNLTSLRYLFSNLFEQRKIDVSTFNTSNATDMLELFYNCFCIRSLDVSRWDTSKVTNMSRAFRGCYLLEDLDVSRWNTSNVTTMYEMFYSCFNLAAIDVSGWDVSKVKSFNNAFCECRKLKNIDLSRWNVSNLCTDIASMFISCVNLKSIDISSFDTSNVTTMYSLFSGCNSIENINVSGLDLSSVTNFSSVFQSCYIIESIDVSSWNVSNGLNFSTMFNHCNNLRKVDISGFDMSKATNVSNMFNECRSLESIIGDKVVDADGGIDGSTSYFGKGPKLSFSFNNYGKLTHDSLMFLMYWIPDRTGSSALTLTIGALNKAKLTAEEIAIATAKNWTVA